MTISMKNISLLHKCIGASGMNGLDILLSFWILKKMKIDIQRQLKKGIKSGQRK